MRNPQMADELIRTIGEMDQAAQALAQAYAGFQDALRTAKRDAYLRTQDPFALDLEISESAVIECLVQRMAALGLANVVGMRPADPNADAFLEVWTRKIQGVMRSQPGRQD